MEETALRWQSGDGAWRVQGVPSRLTVSGNQWRNELQVVIELKEECWKSRLGVWGLKLTELNVSGPRK